MADPSSCGRDWVDFLTALLTPTIAIAGIAIASFQWKINKDRYRHELFDKRWTQFTAIRDFMGKFLTRGKVSPEDEYDFLTLTRGCKFLFDNEIKAFVEETYKKGIYLNALKKELESLTTQDERKRNIENQRTIKNWIENQMNKIEDKFGKFLQL